MRAVIDCRVTMVIWWSTAAVAVVVMDSIRVSCLASARPRSAARRCSGGYDDEALEFVDCLGTTDKHAVAGSAQGSDGFS